MKVVPVGLLLTAAWMLSPGLSWMPEICAGPTVTVAVAVIVPLLPVADSVYVVVC